MPVYTRIFCIFMALFWGGLGQATESPSSTWLVVDIGIIGTASDDILNAAMDDVAKRRLTGLVIQLDTPGGALEATRSMVKNILSANFPVIVWVGPSGAHAGSAGAFITLSGHIAAMAPGTNVGAAHPIQANGQDLKDSEASKKVENDTIAFMESIADVRGRNKDMAVSFVENSASITAEEALEYNVIDIIAPSLDRLMSSVHNRSIKLNDNSEVRLDTNNANFVFYKKSFRQMFLEVISNPNIFYLLFVAGLLGIGFELTHPGSLVPGVVGGICIIMALIATAVLPVSFGALLLIVASIAFMVAEIFIPSFGILGIGGFIAFVAGSILLVDSSNELGLEISLWTIIPGSLGVAGFGLLVAYLVVKAERSKVISGVEGLIGKVVEVYAPFENGSGQVRLDGEFWKAKLDTGGEASKGDILKVKKVVGLTLLVESINSEARKS